MNILRNKIRMIRWGVGGSGAYSIYFHQASLGGNTSLWTSDIYGNHGFSLFSVRANVEFPREIDVSGKHAWRDL